MNNGKRHALSAAILFLASFFPIGSLAAGDSIRLDFRAKQISDNAPTGWEYRGKFGTKDAVFDIVRDAESGTRVLRMTADRATGVVLFDMEDIDLEKYPIMRWKWKVEVLPAGADARIKAKDDQGISIYIGYGRFTQTSVSYAWQTVTPKGETGKSVYNGLVTTYWRSMRDEKDGLNVWYTEERNVRDDIKRLFDTDEIPSGLALSVSTNSQYTGTRAVCFLEYIEFAKK
jgi:hypothetical protein